MAKIVISRRVSEIKYCLFQQNNDKIYEVYHNYTRNTIHCKTPRHFLFYKIICEHFYELVITIAL